MGIGNVIQRKRGSDSQDVKSGRLQKENGTSIRRETALMELTSANSKTAKEQPGHNHSN